MNEVLAAKHRWARLLGPPVALLGEKWGSPAVCYQGSGSWVTGRLEPHWCWRGWPELRVIWWKHSGARGLCQRAVSVEGAQQWNSLSGYAFARLKNEL